MDPLGAIPRHLLHRDLEQIVVRIPYTEQTHRVRIQLVIQLSFEEVYNLVGTAAA